MFKKKDLAIAVALAFSVVQTGLVQEKASLDAAQGTEQASTDASQESAGLAQGGSGAEQEDGAAGAIAGVSISTAIAVGVVGVAVLANVVDDDDSVPPTTTTTGTTTTTTGITTTSGTSSTGTSGTN